MAHEDLIDARVSIGQCKKAVDALHTHEFNKEQKLQESELLPGKEPNIWLNVTVKKMPSSHNFKPAKIPIAHPLVDPRTTPICLITKDPQREYKDLLETHKIKFISRVVGIEKLKGKFKPYEARRMLLKENGLFLADERIIPLLPKLLGVKWFEAKKQPIPVCLKRKDLKGELERAISSTYMNQNKGTCTSVKIGTLSQKPAQILANLQTALPAIAKHIQGGWENIQALHIKTNSSVSLPIWSCNLDESEGGRWIGLTAVEAEEVSDEESDKEEMEIDAVEEKKESPRSKGKKRTLDVAPPAPELSVEATDKTKKKRKVSEAAVDTISSIVELPVEVKDKKKRKVEAATAPPPAVVEPTKDKKKRKVPQTATAPPPAVIEPLVATKDNKKPKVSEAVIAPPPAIVESPVTTKDKKKRKVPEATIAPPPPVVEPPVETKVKKKSKVLTPMAEMPVVAVTSSLTKDELKQKRSGAPGEKKKKVKSGSVKSAKDGVLGKKIAQ